MQTSDSLEYKTPRTSRILPRRKEFVVEDLQEEIRKLKLRIDLLTDEREHYRLQCLKLEARVHDLQNHREGNSEQVQSRSDGA